MTGQLKIGVPSKGRLMEDTLELFRAAGLSIGKSGDERGYRGFIAAMPSVTVEFLSAGEIARHLQLSRIHLGVTGEDLIRELIPQVEEKADLLLKLGFGHATVAVAVPDCWLDVETMADLEEAAALFAMEHGRRLRVATKYPMLARRFFSQKGVVSYRTVESLGATEGAPAAGSAEAIVDITTTGSTLRANGLRILSDGLILKSEANLVASKAALATWETGEVVDEIVQRVEGAVLSLREREQRP
ncbi:MAG: ATP phosphoribosyltransferase [Rhodomicrobium sp.]